VQKAIARAHVVIVGAALVLCACQSAVQGPLWNGSSSAGSQRGWVMTRGIARRHAFPTPIQHVVVIVMENRTVDDLFAAYYGRPWSGPNGGYWQDADNFNLYNPNAEPTLVPNGLSAHFSPSHHHHTSWAVESQGYWNLEPIACPRLPCPPNATAYSYVPMHETRIYERLVERWAFADNVLQSNEGPSFVSHQYLIAAQSGGIQGSLTSPDAEAEEPGDAPGADPTGNYVGRNDEDVKSSGCNPGGYHVPSIDMSMPVPSAPPLDNGAAITSCEEYPTTILDEAERLGGRPIDDWQYIAHSDRSVWAAPLGVERFWQEYDRAHDRGAQPFAVDPDAENFVRNISGSTNPTPDPARPFAALTYITPCANESDHPLLRGEDDGPQWLAWVINAIGESKYWNSTTIIVTWDDWGGWFDHVPAVPVPGPFRPHLNGYAHHDDPNEWGFRVPLMIISPYIVKRGYISSPKTSFKHRSQGVIMQYIEAAFGLPSLGADDMQNGQNDALKDVFDFSRSPLPYKPIATSFSPGPLASCPPAG
jgi:phospholipase C